ncbi:tetratricopeptide repeat protein [Caballeronia sordidicola]|uniref:Flp pilus assembly protein TadD, contains TPR protein n=1 Tax=Caballeronia sordidicola TaxID=196367 RepID=A0A242N6S3_CABSO|nr:tetratricopeptide repeat protein [Caballeronia sordidicola]OTP79282.1 Flp pilus assembly protein TadD, contains TPR protein [Caballeronia sordidicola]
MNASRPNALARGACFAAIAATLVFATSACTTTTQRVAETRPVTRNSAPSSMSELRIAQSALDSGNIDLATTLFEKVVKADPHSVPGLAGLGDTLYAVGDFTRAGVYYERASAADASAAAPLVGSARVAIRQRRFDDAIATYRKVLARTPDEPMSSAGLGVALDMKGDHAAAQAVLRQALKTNPGDPVLSVNLGLSLVLSGNPREGANVLLDVTRFPGAPPQARQDLALAYGLLGNDDAAAQILGRDLPKASVRDNLRFYEAQRARMGAVTSGAALPTAVPLASVQAASIK